MINSDFTDLSRYRGDGRQQNELRETSIALSVDSSVDGSCRLKQGLTEVLCLVRGPYQKHNNNDNLLRFEYTVAPFSTLEKRKSTYDRELSEFVENVRKSFEAIIPEDVYKRHQIELNVSVIHNEGSAKSAIINCISLALANAGIAMRDLIVSCTVATYNGVLLIDTNDEEEYTSVNELVVSYESRAMKVDCVELKQGKIRADELEKAYKFAVEGCNELYRRLKKVLLEYATTRMLVF